MSRTTDLASHDYQLLHDMPFRNVLKNGDFSLWTHGTSQTDTGMDSADLWEIEIGTSASATFSRQAFAPGQVDVPYSPRYYARMEVESDSDLENGLVAIRQDFGPGHLFSGSQAILSFSARASSSFEIATTFNRNWGMGNSNSNFSTKKHQVTTAWKRLTHVIDVPTATGEDDEADIPDGHLQMRMAFSAGSFYTWADLGIQIGTFEVADIQLEWGGVASPFQRLPVIINHLLCGLIT